MAIKNDLTGMTFGELTVLLLSFDEPGKKKKWLCRCSCGNECVVSGSNLVSGHTKRCSACGYKVTAQKVTTHGHTGTKLYQTWNTMKNRCNNPNVKSYSDYGARGIRVCDEWDNSARFIEWALKSGYKEGMEIDRIDTDGDYCPENCRWVSRLENANNKRNNKFITHDGMTKTLAEWSRYYDVNYKSLSRNILKGYSLIEAVERIRSGERTHRGSKAWLANKEG